MTHHSLETLLRRRTALVLVTSIAIVALWAVGTSWAGAIVGATQWARTAAKMVPPLLEREQIRGKLLLPDAIDGGDPALLAALEPGAAAFAMLDGALHVVVRGDGSFARRVVTQPVGDGLLVQLRKIIDAEVVLLTLDGRVLASSLQTAAMTPVTPRFSNPARWERTYGQGELSAPGYGGFRPGRAELAAQPGERFNAFFESWPVPGMDGQPLAQVRVMVPSEVSLFGPKIAAVGVLVVSLLSLVGAMLTTRRFARAQIGPLAEVTEGLNALSGEIVQELGPGPVVVGETDPRLSQELDRLRAAFSALPPLLERWRGTTDVLRSTGERLGVQAAELAVQRDRAQAAERHKARFLATVSHELRTPLTGLLGLGDALLDTELDAHQREMAGALRECGEHLKILLEELLEFSAIEGRGVTLHPRTTDLAGVVRSTLEMLRPAIRDRGLDSSLRIGAAVPEVVLVDPVRVRQVLVNLLSNAMKFTPTGSIEVELDARVEGGQAAISLSVRDTGTGIPASKRQAIFEPFVQVHDPSQAGPDFGGVGLGLSICQRIAEAMGGSLAALDPEQGSGTRFVLRFSAAIGQAGETPVSPPLRHYAGARVLVVDDVEFNRKVAGMYLRRLGCEASEANSGEEALSLLTEQSWDLVLMDCHMPELDGPETTARWRAMEPPGRRVPVIALTADSQSSTKQRCLAAGVDELLPKPIQPSLLAETLQRWLGEPSEVAV